MTPPKSDARAYLRDVAFHLQRVENSARFAEYYGAPAGRMEQIRKLAERMRREAAEIARTVV